MYGWIIDTDHVEETAVGITGPALITPDKLKLLQSGKGRKFKMFDDDNELMYTGRYIESSDTDGTGRLEDLSEDGFGPLDDFGTPNAGCTSIQYLSDAGTWETL